MNRPLRREGCRLQSPPLLVDPLAMLLVFTIVIVAVEEGNAVRRPCGLLAWPKPSGTSPVRGPRRCRLIVGRVFLRSPGAG